MTQDEIAALIPANVVEAATRSIAELCGCDRAVFSTCVSAKEMNLPCKCEQEARASLAAGLAAWGGMTYTPQAKPLPASPAWPASFTLPIEEPTP